MLFIYAFKKHLVRYNTPLNLTYFWSFGSLAGIFLAIQLITGILLAVHYISYSDVSFENLEHIMRDVNYGWLIRYLHANSASFFFISIYLHVFRGIYYKSFYIPRNHVWNSGVLILLVSIIVAFLGYVLPWGQMSYWAATVITNLVTAVPVIGKYIVNWLWGGYTVTGVTLVRFYDLHYLLAIVLTIIVVLHILLLHEVGSSNPLGVKNARELISFYRFFFLKDLLSLILMLLLLAFVVFYYPNVLGHSDNFIKANPLVTPTHIVPEWYFLPFYAILRSIDDKLIGVIALLLSILVLFTLPLKSYFMKNENFFIVLNDTNWFFILFLSVSIILGVLGSLPAEAPYTSLSKLFTKIYFSLFIINYIIITSYNNIIILSRFFNYRF